MWSVVFLTLLGVSLAANLPLLPPLLAGLAGLYGGLHGLMNGSTLTAIGAGWPGLLGIVTAVLLVALLLAALAVSLQAEWTRVAVRVVGSWVAAVGLLMLGWMVQSVS
jgi:hydrogenase/urease accessory protein HupE